MTLPLPSLPSAAEWLAKFPWREDYFEISPVRAFAHPEGDYDTQYNLDPSNLDVGRGAVRLLKSCGCDTSGPALEIGCGTGLLTLGLVAEGAYPAVVITDPSPAFLRITEKKLHAQGLGNDQKTFYASFTGEELKHLPANTFSLIILRSVLHHVLDVEEFLAATARVLKPGGAFVCEEPCGEGFLLMGTLAQFVPVVMAKAKKPLSKEHARMIQGFCDTMHFYLRRDVDKSTAEDKHLFRVDEIMKWGERCGLSTRFFANAAFPQFVHSTPGDSTPFDVYRFFKQYLQYCMNFGPDLIAAFDREFAPYVKFVQDASAGWSGPHFSGVFLCKKTIAESIPGDTLL